MDAILAAAQKIIESAFSKELASVEEIRFVSLPADQPEGLGL